MRSRFFWFWFALTVFFGLLFLRLVQLTLLEGARNRALADSQRVRIQKITAPRGMIYDRRNQPLVANLPVYKKCHLEDSGCQVIKREEALSLQAQNRDADLTIDIGRMYPYGEAMVHLLGYLGELSESEVKSGQGELGKLVGRTGLEEQYDRLLAGIDGGELIEADTEGKILRKIGQKTPVPGVDLYLSLDAGLQKVAYEAMVGKKGAVVVQDPKTGAILALVSSPGFDPNDLEKEAFDDPSAPFFNRAISGAYPPGSTFKIVTATAALEEKKITEQTKIEDTGVIIIGKYRYTNWYFTGYGKTEGWINLVQALKRSNDIFFYKLGEMVGATKLVAWGKIFGLGQVLGLDLPGEIPGFLPDISRDWFLGNTYHLAIGQGNLGLTPLQVNTLTNVIASGGWLCQPTLRMVKKGECREINLQPETITLITEGMKEVCSEGGTAYPLFGFQPQVACKTGTAEFNDPRGRTHAWLTLFAPALDPQITVTVLVEAGGEGSVVAAPIAKKILEEWFRK